MTFRIVTKKKKSHQSKLKTKSIPCPGSLLEALHFPTLVTPVMSGHWLLTRRGGPVKPAWLNTLLSAFSSLECKSDGVSCLEALFPLWVLEHIAGHL